VRRTDLHFLPLGGTGEIGMNLNAWHFGGKWLLVDAGVLFERRSPTETAVLYPSPAFLADKVEDIVGLVLTHAHQDHVGAVADLWPRLRCPVYGTRFAIEMLDGPLRESGLWKDVPRKVIGERQRWSLGPFDLQRIPLTHSTVEMGALVIRTPGGTVLHTGDWKLDPDPIVGAVSDEGALTALRHETIHACVSDSTNALTEGWTPSEGSLREPLQRLIEAQPGRVAVALFSSNIARVRTLGEIAEQTGRHVVLVGRSLQRTVEAAQRAGYLASLGRFVDRRDYGFLPRRSVLLLCTGSQGDPRAGMTALAENNRTDIYLEKGDTAVFSARRIPGCELSVDRVQRLLTERHIRVVDDRDWDVHVSGHPRREELRAMYRMVRPRTVVPVHGTPRHLDAHAELATDMGLQAANIRNGDVLRIGDPCAVVRRVPVGREQRVEDGAG
jgi:ribonuclease J